MQDGISIIVFLTTHTQLSKMSTDFMLAFTPKKRTSSCDEDNRGGPSRDKSLDMKAEKEPSLDMKAEKEPFTYDKNTCRVCLKRGDIPIYGKQDISEDLNHFTGLEVKRDDSFPKNICRPCNQLLKGAIMLRKTAQNTDKLLKQTIASWNPTAVDTDDFDWFDTMPPIDSVKTERRSSDEFLSDIKLTEETKKKDKKVSSINKKNKNEVKVKVKSTKTFKNFQVLGNEFNEEVDKNKEMTCEEDSAINKAKTSVTYYCQKCDISFNTIDECNKHRTTTNHCNLRQVCPICHKSYQPGYFKTHLEFHTENKQHMCDICGNKFVTKAQLIRHRETHFIENLPFQCTLCPYRGRFKQYLKLHMKTHTNDKQFSCPQCPTRFFIRKCNLKKHMLTHKADHDFKCDQCQKGFHMKSQLEMHIKVDHNGIKDHMCDICGRAFGFRKQMMKHKLKVHNRPKMRSGKTPLYMILESRKQQEEIMMEEKSHEVGIYEGPDGS